MFATHVASFLGVLCESFALIAVKGFLNPEERGEAVEPTQPRVSYRPPAVANVMSCLARHSVNGSKVATPSN
jgi:hypothetical protein